MPKIVFLDEYSLGRSDLSGIRSLGNYTGYEYTRPEEVVTRCLNAEIVITNKVVLGRNELQQLPHLRLICVAATGTNNIDLDAAAELGITVRNAAGYSTVRYFISRVISFGSVSTGRVSGRGISSCLSLPHPVRTANSTRVRIRRMYWGFFVFN